MIGYDHPLWFDSCLGNTIINALILLLITAMCIVGIEWIRRRTKHELWKQSGRWLQYGIALLSIAATLFMFYFEFSPRVVQIALNEGQIFVRACHRHTDVRQTYKPDEVSFGYVVEERGTQRMRHHMLIMQKDGTRIAAVELSSPRVDFGVLRRVAPGAVAEYDKAFAR